MQDFTSRFRGDAGQQAADRFITSNRRDFPAMITVIQVTCPAG